MFPPQLLALLLAFAREGAHLATMQSPMPPTISADRLYGISMRPHELAHYGEAVTFSLRYGSIFDDPAEETSAHFTLLVLEIHAAEGTGPEGQRLELLRCGWEMERTTVLPCRVDSVPELPSEVPLLLSRVADTVNELARRAGLEAPLGSTVIDRLLLQYQAGNQAGKGKTGNT